ncbi:alpha/beta fold hydrolase [Paenibacillus sp. PCH8]|uniref:alpha/beta fold hydrolase n=1 Tax=Paenibacillus sp. PCH8 TaxID=2066524 RepID=UPI0015E3CD4B|nr:alpha/beta hydrolase [Paenibacillus sp. PCH8]
MKSNLVLILTFCLVFLIPSELVEGKPSQIGSSGLYEVSNGVSLYAEIQGVPNSLPTVVFISGYGDSSSIWSKVQPEIAKHTLTVSYDRAGLGLSGETNKDKTTKQQVKELHKLLRKANIPGPYLLVGHSIGGLNVRAFADRYNNEVAGAVLIDSSHENQEAAIMATLPPEFIDLYKSQFSAEGDYAEVMKSFSFVAKIRSHDALRHIPLTVISATEHGMGLEMEVIWAELQEDLAALSDKANHITVEGSGHYVHLESAELVVAEIHSLLRD